MSEPGADSEDKDDDRREFARVPVRIEVRFSQPQQAARAFRAYSLNFSVGGICVKTQKEHAVGDALIVAMSIAGESFDLSSVVAWCRGGAIGVRFEDVSEADRERLGRIIDSLTSTTPRDPT